MNNYIDAFVHPIPTQKLGEYRSVVNKVAAIWKEHGAIDYCEFVGDDLRCEGTRSFLEMVNIENDETVLFGWVAFESKQARDQVNELVAADKRMNELIGPLIADAKPIFSAKRMAYGGFKTLFSNTL